MSEEKEPIVSPVVGAIKYASSVMESYYGRLKKELEYEDVDMDVIRHSRFYQLTQKVPRERGMYCLFDASSMAFQLEKNPLVSDAQVHSIQWIVSELLEYPDFDPGLSHGHSFSIIKGEDGNSFIADNTFQQFFTADTKVVGTIDGEMNTVKLKGKEDPLVRLLRNGYMELTKENFKRYVQALSREDLHFILSGKIDTMEDLETALDGYAHDDVKEEYPDEELRDILRI